MQEDDQENRTTSTSGEKKKFSLEISEMHKIMSSLKVRKDTSWKKKQQELPSEIVKSKALM